MLEISPERIGEHATIGGRIASSRSAGAELVAQQRLRHDVRQPLAALLMLASGLENEPALPSSARRTVGLIVSQAEWIAELLADGEDRDTRGHVDLARAAEEIRDVLAATSDSVLVVQPSRAVLVSVDPIGLRRLVRNVVENAVRAAGPHGRVEIAVRAVPPFGEMEVCDSGPGFGRLRRQQGLGLLTVRRLLEEADGGMTVGSSHLGGARVALRVPLASGVAGVVRHGGHGDSA